MRIRRIVGVVSALGLPLVLLATSARPAFAWGHGFTGKVVYNARAGYAVPIQYVYQYPAVLVPQPSILVPPSARIPLPTPMPGYEWFGTPSPPIPVPSYYPAIGAPTPALFPSYP